MRICLEVHFLTLLLQANECVNETQSLLFFFLDCIECMAASDNVVRSGLTPKFKDVDTLVNMLTYNHGPADAQLLSGVPFKGSKVTTLYDPPIREFAVLKTELSRATEKEDLTKGLNGPSVLIVTGGEGSIRVVDTTTTTTTTGKKQGSDADEEESLITGSVFFVGAGVSVLLKAGQEGSLTVYRAFCE